VTAAQPGRAHTARTNAPCIICQAQPNASISGTPGLHFRTIADMAEPARHDGQGTANAVGW
jgi:hypothetical protein